MLYGRQRKHLRICVLRQQTPKDNAKNLKPRAIARGIFLSEKLYFFQNRFLILSQIKKRIPKNSNPTKTSHEPGVNGVTRAVKPTKIKTIPANFFSFGFIASIFLIYSFIFFGCRNLG